ncbi:MAG: class D beta-lactamase [Ferruginibacter sp.]|nr:class D beta-lactamase [Cytophagales bacterium]
MLKIVFSLVFWVLFFCGAGAQPKRITRDFSRYFAEDSVKGCFVLYDLKKDQYVQYNPQRCQTRFIPASTFKIPNTLIGLETGVVTGKDFALKWDGVHRRVPDWNQDLDLQTAFRVSAFWFYQEIARRVGPTRMRQYVTKLGYGNGDIGGGIDQFWLTGKLAISPEEQVAFLSRLYHNQLPFSPRSVDLVKEMMILEDTLGHTLRGKTGWADWPDKNIGWMVGYLEQNGNVYFFATNVESGPVAPTTFVTARRRITEKILRALGLVSGR